MSDLRVALFSGNYNYVRDGANQALNQLVGFLLRQGVQVRVYSPTTDTPAFPAVGDVVSVASLPFPFGRGEYRFSLGMPAATRRDLEQFAPNIVHVSAPDILGHRAISYARKRGVPVLASMHTRFETYFKYYRLGWLVPAVMSMLRRFYSRPNVVMAPSASMIEVMRGWGVKGHVSVWARGIDTSIFAPEKRDLNWRRSLGIGDEEVVIGYLGRLVIEKGLDVFAESINALKKRGVAHRVLIIGEGPAREWFAEQIPEAVFVGFQSGQDLGRALASLDLLFNPSLTEAFGNVMLEAMACGLPVVAAHATGSRDLVQDGETGRLLQPGDATAFVDALERYCTDNLLRKAHGRSGEIQSRRYDWDRVNQAVLDQYRKLVSG